MPATARARVERTRQLRPADLAGAQQRVFELEDTLAEAGEELTAVRDINHELLARANRAGG